MSETTATARPELTRAEASRLFANECSKHVSVPGHDHILSTPRALVHDLSHTVNEDDVVWWECTVDLGDAEYHAQFCELDPHVEINWS